MASIWGIQGSRLEEAAGLLYTVIHLYNSCQCFIPQTLQAKNNINLGKLETITLGFQTPCEEVFEPQKHT